MVNNNSQNLNFILTPRNFPIKAFTLFCSAPYTKVSMNINKLLYTSMPPKGKFQVWPDIEKDILIIKLVMLVPQGLHLHKLYTENCVSNMYSFS